MSPGPRKPRHTFRPTLDGLRLEDRVVLSAAGAARLHAQIAALQFQPNAGNAVTAGVGNITPRQLHAAYAQQYRAAYNNLKQYVNAQVAQLYQFGRPNAQQLADFNANVNGAINATALRLSSQFALLPNSSRRLVPAVQNDLLGSGPRSLTTRLQNVTLSGRFTGSERALQNALDRRINAASSLGHARLANHFNTTNFRRLSVDQNGRRIPLGQYLGNQVMSQFGNTLGSLSSSFPNAASGLFANGATPTSAAVNAFNQQALNALGVASFQLGSALSLFPNAAATLGPQLRSGFFGTGTNPATGQPFNSLYGGLQNLPFTTATSPNAFNTAAQNVFNNGFGNIAGPLSNFFGLPTQMGANGQANFNLPSGPFNNVFGSQFSGNSFNNGFNNGFGNGFIGFGQSPNGFNNNFGTGFNNIVGNGSAGFGFTGPLSGSLNGTGNGTGFGNGLTNGFAGGLNNGFNNGFGTGSGFGNGFGNGLNFGSGNNVNNGFGSGFNIGTGTNFNNGFGAGFNNGNGLTTGLNNGFGNNFNNGLNNGFGNNFNNGLNNGFGNNFNNGLMTGTNNGFGNGLTTGLNNGFGNGLNTGFGNGLNTGLGNGLNNGFGAGSTGIGNGLNTGLNGNTGVGVGNGAGGGTGALTGPTSGGGPVGTTLG